MFVGEYVGAMKLRGRSSVGLGNLRKPKTKEIIGHGLDARSPVRKSANCIKNLHRLCYSLRCTCECGHPAK